MYRLIRSAIALLPFCCLAWSATASAEPNLPLSTLCSDSVLPGTDPTTFACVFQRHHLATFTLGDPVEGAPNFYESFTSSDDGFVQTACVGDVHRFNPQIPTADIFGVCQILVELQSGEYRWFTVGSGVEDGTVDGRKV